MVVGQFNYDRVQVGRASACLVLISLTDRQTRQAEACPTKQIYPLPTFGWITPVKPARGIIEASSWILRCRQPTRMTFSWMALVRFANGLERRWNPTIPVRGFGSWITTIPV